MSSEYEKWMHEALAEANKAYDNEEVPVGALIIRNDEIIGRGYNQIEKNKSTFMHAEIIAIKQAQKHLGDWRLNDCMLVCTLEPCIMCASAAVLARIDTIIFGAADPKFGGCGSILNIPAQENLNHRINIISGVLENESIEMMQSFFRKIRNKKMNRGVEE